MLENAHPHHHGEDRFGASPWIPGAAGTAFTDAGAATGCAGTDGGSCRYDS